MQKTVFLVISMITLSAVAEEAARKPYPKIYPFVPVNSQELLNDVKRVSEDPQAETNIYSMYAKGLLKEKETQNTPWVSTYWPLNKGGIADPYKGNSGVLGDIVRPRKILSWEHNYNRLKYRRGRQNMMDWSEGALAGLAPSEKYDLLLGDMTFDLTNRQLDYMYKWGSKKQFGFLSNVNIMGGGAYEYAQLMFENGFTDESGNKYSSIEDALPDAVKLRGGIADEYALKYYRRGNVASFQDALAMGFKEAAKVKDNYVLEEKNNLMALWEGICNGWSTAAGVIPRPLHSFSIKLPNGKDLKFYPEDVKALISQYWFNSLIQNSKSEYTDQVSGEEKFNGGTLMQGLRCNNKSPKKDEWGRFYDSEPDPYSKTNEIEPRCVGVHPAIWHMALINIIGKQGRSFIVERKIKAAVDNHPMSDYKMSFFNPYTGDDGHLSSSIKEINRDDQFYKFRNKNAKYIVGVSTTMAYIDWIRPVRLNNESSDYDKNNREFVDMMYDLELDANGEIVGGQWRAAKTGKTFLNFGKGRKQPDFFWVITKDWKKSGYFDEIQGLPQWTDTTTTPPKEWLAAAKVAHSFKYNKTHAYGWNEKCKVINKVTGASREVPCEYKEDKPQPLLNVVNKLLELSRQ